MSLTKAKKEENGNSRFFYAIGKRKTSIAQIRLYKKDGSEAANEIEVNGKTMKNYFPLLVLQNICLSPFKVAEMDKSFKASFLIKGGGVKGQAEAARLALARALVKFNPDFKKSLKGAGYLTRDSRIVERKKAGLKKARRAPQWAKR